MTLVAIYYNSTTTSNNVGSNNDHSKWKRGLALISPKHYYKKKYKSSPTTVAAATEKVLCHTKEQDIIKSEDLTAKEFAKITGIKIKSDQDEEDSLNTVSSIKDEVFSQMTSFSSRTAFSSKSGHQIWDSDFWQTTSTSINNNKLAKLNTTDSNKTTAYCDTLAKTNNFTVPNVIQKGRFKIIVGQDNAQYEPISQPHHQVVLEWKRKRSNSSATNLTPTTKKSV